MSTKLKVLKQVQAEVNRFNARLNAAIEEQHDKTATGTSRYAALKRSAMDLKTELTQITAFNRVNKQA